MEERDDYRHFVVHLANEVAAAHRKHGQDVSPRRPAPSSRSRRYSARTGPDQDQVKNAG